MTTRGTPIPTDARGNDIQVGQLVLYTTNREGGAFEYGTVIDIKTAHDFYDYTARGGDKWDAYTHRIRMARTDIDGNPKMEYEWLNGKREDTDVQQKSGLVNHSPNKFLIL